MNSEIEGIEIGTSVDVELCKEGIVEIMTDAPRTCCVAVVKLDMEGLNKLIASLQLAKVMIEDATK